MAVSSPMPRPGGCSLHSNRAAVRARRHRCRKGPFQSDSDGSYAYTMISGLAQGATSMIVDLAMNKAILCHDFPKDGDRSRSENWTSNYYFDDRPIVERAGRCPASLWEFERPSCSIGASICSNPPPGRYRHRAGNSVTAIADSDGSALVAFYLHGPGDFRFIQPFRRRSPCRDRPAARRDCPALSWQ